MPAITSNTACIVARRTVELPVRVRSDCMKVKLTLLSVLAIASMVITLLALSADSVSQASPDRESGSSDIDSSY